jgi:aminoglycoside phosphotransferase (APT) family kinase protein
MHPDDAPGPLLASGRDGDIFEYGEGRVLRRARGGRSIAHEADIMNYVAERGYRVPKIYEVLNDGRDIVMERIEGPTMARAIEQKPWTLFRQARELARLHKALHQISAPDWLPQAPVGGTALVHRDLHPLNVLMSPSGPVVIDWANAAAGAAHYDVADTWLVMSVGGLENPTLFMRVLLRFRAALVSEFVKQFDRAEVVPLLRASTDERSRDRNMSASEIAAMWRIVEKEEAKLAKKKGARG